MGDRLADEYPVKGVSVIIGQARELQYRILFDWQRVYAVLPSLPGQKQTRLLR